MKKTKKKAIYGSKIVDVAPVVRTVYLDDNGEEVITVNGVNYKIADLEKNDKIFLIVSEY